MRVFFLVLGWFFFFVSFFRFVLIFLLRIHILLEPVLTFGD